MKFALLLLGLCFVFASSKSILSAPTGDIEIYSPSVLVHHYFQRSGKLVLAVPPNACSQILNAAELNGNIAYLYTGGCGGLQKLANLDAANVTGAVFVNPGFDGGTGGYSHIVRAEGLQGRYFNLEAVEIRFNPVLEKLIRLYNGKMNITIADDEDLYLPLATVYILLSIFVGGMAVAYGTLATIKLIRIIREVGRVEASAQQLILFFVIVCALERLLLVIDPWFRAGIYPYIIANILLTGSHDLMLISVLWLSTWWISAARMSNANPEEKAHPSGLITKIRIPIILISVVLLVLEVISAFARGYYLDSFALLIFVDAILYIIIGGIIAIVYCVGGARMLFLLNRTLTREAPGSKERRNTIYLIRLSVLIILCGCGVIVFVAGIITYIMARSPTNVFVSTLLTYVGLSWVSMIQALIFEAFPSPSSSETMKGSGSSSGGNGGGHTPPPSKRDKAEPFELKEINLNAN